MNKSKNFLIGITSSLILLINTILLATLMIPLGIIKFLIPLKNLRASFTKLIIKIGELWIEINSLWVINLHKPNLEIIGRENLSENSWFLSTSNNQSAADIFIVQYITNKKIPMLKFFITSPANSITKPVPPAVPIVPIIFKITSLAVTPAGNFPLTLIFKFFDFF